MNTNLMQGRGKDEGRWAKVESQTWPAQRAIPTSGSEGRQRGAGASNQWGSNQRPAHGSEFLDCQGGLFRAVDWERERDDWRTRFAVVLTVAVAGWATVAVLVALV